MAHNTLSGMANEILHSILTEVYMSSAEGGTTESSKRTSPLNGISRSSKHFRELCIPFLFQNMAIKNPSHMVEIKDSSFLVHVRYHLSPLACQNLPELSEKADHVIITTRSFNLDAKKYTPFLAPQLISTLSQTPRLTKLSLRIPESHIPVMSSFSQLITLPTIEVLILGPYCEFMLSKCPNVTTIANNLEPNTVFPSLTRPAEKNCFGNHKSSITFIRAIATAKLPHLQHVDITEKWHAAFIRVVAMSLRNLPSITMQGCFSRMIVDYPHILACFTKLEHLAVEGCWWSSSSGGWVSHEAYMADASEGFEERFFSDCGKKLKDVWVGSELKLELVEQIPHVIHNPMGDRRIEDVVIKKCEGKRPRIGEYLRVQKGLV